MANAGDAAYKAAYKALNNEQKQAVDQLDGPVLVIAGPGTGKTQLLATRVGRILEQTDAGAENILCLTFSESAVRAMKQRLVNVIGPAARDVMVSTYHAFGRDLIASNAEEFNQETILANPADDLLLDKLLRQIQAELPY
ncbi:MAG: UvrD-helicase domain-containing protein, partial [Candidatus Saccharimonadales bacterium]